MAAGRPRKINDELIDRMKNYMIAGLSLKDACSLLEIDYSTWNKFEKNNPNFSMKRKKWQGQLKARAQANISNEVINHHDPNWSAWILERETKLEEKRANNALIRARARREKAQAKMIEEEQTHANQLADNALDKLGKLSTDDLVNLSKLGDIDDEDN